MRKKMLPSTKQKSRGARGYIPVSKTDNWATPQYLYDEYNAKYQLTCDAAASARNTKCPKFFTKKQDGLKQDWGTERVWCNPPYGRVLGKWMQKADDACRAGATVVMLVPSRTDTKWFHKIAMKRKKVFLKGRVKFGNGKSPAPFPSLVVVFTPRARRRGAAGTAATR
jgi:site-specific DNA-methyltransferase (adenine-specific)